MPIRWVCCVRLCDCDCDCECEWPLLSPLDLPSPYSLILLYTVMVALASASVRVVYNTTWMQWKRLKRPKMLKKSIRTSRAPCKHPSQACLEEVLITCSLYSMHLTTKGEQYHTRLALPSHTILPSGWSWIGLELRQEWPAKMIQQPKPKALSKRSHIYTDDHSCTYCSTVVLHITPYLQYMSIHVCEGSFIHLYQRERESH